MFSRFVSIDIETTGLDPEQCQVIEFGAVIDDWLNPLDVQPEFHCYVKHEIYQGEPYALSMHAEIFRRIATQEDGYTYLYPGQVAPKFYDWALENGAVQVKDDAPPIDSPDFNVHKHYHKLNVAGKNFASFDRDFLMRMPRSDCFKFRHRTIDPAMSFWNPFTDKGLPNTELCMERAGIAGDVAHTAIEDAKVVIRLIHHAVTHMTHVR